jgi:hypothetical protein
VHPAVQLITNTVKEKLTMATVQEVEDSLAKLVADVKAEIAALQAKIDAGSAIEAADLDGIKNAIDLADASLNPPPPPAG